MLVKYSWKAFASRESSATTTASNISHKAPFTRSSLVMVKGGVAYLSMISPKIIGSTKASI